MSRKLRLQGHPAAAVLVAALAAISGRGFAQTTPDAGSILRQIEQQRPAPLPPSRPQPRQAPPPLQTLGQAVVTVKAFQFAGNTLLDETRLRAAVVGFLGRPLSFGELQNAAVAVAENYRAAGWVVRAYLPQQDITEGRVTIQIVEAVFGKVRLMGNAKRVAPERLQRIVERAQAPGQPVNGNALDRALLLLDDLPGITASGRLNEGEGQAETDLLLTVEDGPLISGDVAADNTGARSTGAARLSLNAALNSPLGWADQANMSLLHTSGSNYGRLAYAVPLGWDGLRVGVNLSHLAYRLVTPEFAAVDARGTSSTNGLDLNYPLLRSRLYNVYGALTYDSKVFDNLSAGVTATYYKTQSATLGLSGNLFDELGAGGSSTFNLAFGQGKVNLDASPNQAADAATTMTAGRFTKLRYAVSRQQVLGDTFSLFASFAGQTASKNLDSSEKFYLGGSGGVRAYPASEAGGSEGQLLSIELRARLPGSVSATGFVDTGSVRVNKRNDFTGAPALNTYRLSGGGLAVAWTAPFGLSLKATLAHRIGSNPNPTPSGRDQDGSLQPNRYWLQASQSF